MTAPLRGARKVAAPSASIEFDVRCVRCRFNLRGLVPSARCPECGEPISSSLRSGGGKKDQFERTFAALFHYGNGLRFGLALPGVPALAIANCLTCIVGMGSTVAMLAGSAQKLLGLYQMWTFKGEDAIGSDDAFSRAVFTACVEAVCGLAFLASMLFGASALLSPTLADFLYPFLFAAWSASCSLSAVTAMLLADSLAKQHDIEDEWITIPAPLLLVGPALMSLAVLLHVLASRGNGDWLGVTALVLGIPGALVWWVSIAASGVHVTSVATSISLKFGAADRKPDSPEAIARRIGGPTVRPLPKDTDETPIPLD